MTAAPNKITQTELNRPWDAGEILAYFRNRRLEKEAERYLRFHCRRYAVLLREVHKCLGKIREAGKDEPIKILDIGPYFETDILREIWPETIVNSLGLFKEPRSLPRPQDRHFRFDLNDAQDPEKWLALEKHDLIVMAEVIEHLHAAPEAVLRCAASWLKTGGCLIIQTPNAGSLHNRLKTAAGRNLFGMIRPDRNDPGHFREYAPNELLKIANESGFVVAEYATANYFGDSLGHKIYRLLGPVLPRKWRAGITVCLEKRN